MRSIFTQCFHNERLDIVFPSRNVEYLCIWHTLHLNLISILLQKVLSYKGMMTASTGVNRLSLPQEAMQLSC